MRTTWSALAILALAAGSAVPVRPNPEVRIRTTSAFAACLASAVETFNRSSGIQATIDIGEPDPPGNADLVVGDDSEMTRLLESGVAEIASAADLGYLPWLVVVPAGSPARFLPMMGVEPLSVPGGRAGREARAWLSSLGSVRVRVTGDGTDLRGARYALVPRSLAGPGEQRPAAGLRPLVATAAVIAGGPHAAEARRLLDFLRSDAARGLLAGCLDPGPPGAAPSVRAANATAQFALSVVDWWLPQCSLDRNGYNDPLQALGPPDAVSLGGGSFRGFISLGQGGFVTVDMGVTITDGPGPDIRVYQTVSGEPVTVYASMSATGPFMLIGLRVPCGTRTSDVFSNHCDFDLRDGGLAQARYLKIEDGEIYPCLAGGTPTEGADLDSVEALNRP